MISHHAGQPLQCYRGHHLATWQHDVTFGQRDWHEALGGWQIPEPAYGTRFRCSCGAAPVFAQMPVTLTSPDRTTLLEMEAAKTGPYATPTSQGDDHGKDLG